MIIELTKDDRIRRLDKHNLVYETRHDSVKKDTKEVVDRWRIEAYYSRLSQLILALPDHVMMLDDVRTVKDLVSRQTAINAALSRVIKKLSAEAEEVEI